MLSGLLRVGDQFHSTQLGYNASRPAVPQSPGSSNSGGTEVTVLDNTFTANI